MLVKVGNFQFSVEGVAGLTFERFAQLYEQHWKSKETSAEQIFETLYLIAIENKIPWLEVPAKLKDKKIKKKGLKKSKEDSE